MIEWKQVSKLEKAWSSECVLAGRYLDKRAVIHEDFKELWTFAIVCSDV